MNEGNDQDSKNTLFDENMNGTIHLAPGRAYEPMVEAEHERNQSGIHLDLVENVG